MKPSDKNLSKTLTNKMKTFYTQLIMLFALCSLLMACESEDGSFSQAATLRVVHTVPDAPSVHVNYFGFDELNFSVNPVLRFGRNQRYTVAANELRDVRFTYASDTTQVVYNREITLDPGQVATFYLAGDSAGLSGFLLTETFQNYTDSVFGVSFVHAANDPETVSVRAIQVAAGGLTDTTSVEAPLTLEAATDYIQFEATAGVEGYTFQYLDVADSVLASFTIDPLRTGREKVFRNITLPFIGSLDDGTGNSTLSVTLIDNF